MDVSRIVVPELSIWSTACWVRGINVMTAFTADTACRIDADVEAWVAAGVTGLGVTRLAIEHTLGEGSCQAFGSRAVIGWIEEGAIRRVRSRAAARPEILQFHG